jgi:phosphopantothenoylcysteine decarboxylase/phosphopantothenate--cysteine ligase
MGEQRHVVVGVSGGIAAYKAAEVVRGIQKAGHEVRVVMTKSATEFVGPMTFEALTGRPVLTDLFEFERTPIAHVELGEWADLMVVVPATANVCAKLATGIADDALTATALAMTAPVMVVPAMNTNMWTKPSTRRNMALLENDGIHVMTPATGRLACGVVGEGKLPEVDAIVEETLFRLAKMTVDQDLAGCKVVVTAGPTHEAIDPVRYIANASSGKMGFSLAKAASLRGAEVTLVAGPVALATPAHVARIDVVGAADMAEATFSAAKDADFVVCAAAVADYTPRKVADHKLKKSEEHIDSIELVETTDILSTLGHAGLDAVICGFAAETNDVERHALDKLARKGADAIVANDVSRADSTFGSDTNAVTVYTEDGSTRIETAPKAEVADRIFDILLSIPKEGR